MSTDQFTVGPHIVRTHPVPAENAVQVYIDDRELQVYLDPNTGRYSTTKIPYHDFDDLRELAKTIVEKHPDFRE